MTDPVIHASLTADGLRDLLQSAGYRVERIEEPEAPPTLRSATAGMAFDLRPANPLPTPEGAEAAFADAVFQAAFRVEGALPLDLVNGWNGGRRFGRLSLRRDVLALEMDISVLGGVAPGHLRAQVEIWDHLVRQLITYLREELPRLGAGPSRGARSEDAGPENAPAAEARTAEARTA
jgi:hypothetical protein